ncbi:hypothetical protein [Psychrilyobacter sp.]
MPFLLSSEIHVNKPLFPKKIKELSIILAAITISGVTYGAQLELKGEFEP